MPVRWKLHQIMFDRRLNNSDLAKATDFHVNTISKLKNLRVMPNRLEHRTLDRLCKALECKVPDLLEYYEDE